MPAIIPETEYDSVVFKGSVGTLKLSDEHLSFHTPEKVSVVPWKKVVRRQVASSASNTAKPMFKLILKSGTEAIFQMEDRVSLEVLRDDLGERLQSWRRLNPEKPEEHVAINKTNFTARRQSTPYRMVNTSQTQQGRDSKYPEKPQQPNQRPTHRRASAGPSTQRTYQQQPQKPRRASYMGQPPKRHSVFGKSSERRGSVSPPPFCRTYSGETIKQTNNRRSARY